MTREPVRPALDAPVATRALDRTAPAATKERILVIDDEANIRSTVEEFLSLGFEPSTQRKLLWDNYARLYKTPEPATPPG